MPERPGWIASRPSRDWTAYGEPLLGAGQDHQALAVGEGQQVVGGRQVALGEVGAGPTGG